ncbi:MAG: SET domain-containing protein-lysine N-methyltransferase [Chitinophagales bacterium]|nr:SET domain-containing protein-lysine N-methyltransferase [Chitinophagales bacterium]
MFFHNTNRINQPAGLETRPSLIHGQGVFAGRFFKKGELIEKAPVILLDNADWELLRGTFLFGYYFLLNNNKYPAALGLGLSSLYNHAVDANAAYTISVKKQCLIFKALRSIDTGEEITLNYNGRAGDASPVFFPSPAV